MLHTRICVPSYAYLAHTAKCYGTCPLIYQQRTEQTTFGKYHFNFVFKNCVNTQRQQRTDFISIFLSKRRKTWTKNSGALLGCNRSLLHFTETFSTFLSLSLKLSPAFAQLYPERRRSRRRRCCCRRRRRRRRIIRSIVDTDAFVSRIVVTNFSFENIFTTKMCCCCCCCCCWFPMCWLAIASFTL